MNKKSTVSIRPQLGKFADMRITAHIESEQGETPVVNISGVVRWGADRIAFELIREHLVELHTQLSELLDEIPQQGQPTRYL